MVINYIADGLYMSDPVGHAESVVLNIGSNREITINSLAEMIIEMVGSRSKIVHTEEREDDPHRRSADISKAKRLLNWELSTQLDDSLRGTIEWMENRYL